MIRDMEKWLYSKFWSIITDLVNQGTACEFLVPSVIRESYVDIIITINLVTGTTMRKVSKYGVFSGLYFPVFGLNTGK